MSRAKKVTINSGKIKRLAASAGISIGELAYRIGLRNPHSLYNALSKGEISEKLADLIGVVLNCWPEYFTDQLLYEGLTESMDVPRPYLNHIEREIGVEYIGKKKLINEMNVLGERDIKRLNVDAKLKATGGVLSDEARAKKNEYRRQWYQRNKNKCKEYNTRYWERKAAECEGEAQTN